MYAQQQVDGLKITFFDNETKTQTFQLNSADEWGYDPNTHQIFVKPIGGDLFVIDRSRFIQFEFPTINQNIKKAMFSGYVQKGPYLNGSSITITQLDEDLNQTGTVFSTQIIDNSGNFERRNIEFTSNFIELKADGYYFNEVKGEISASQLTLYGLADITNLSSVNVNILTHLERQRIMYLIQDGSLSFADAKQQAREEVLNIFKFVLPDDISNESLNIVDDAVLLAASVIIQGHLSTGEMSELLANISADIRKDGTLDNPVLGSQLKNNAAYLDLDLVKANMDQKYSGMGIDMNVSVDELKSYIQQFIDNCGFEQTSFITYPVEGRYGLNILNEEFVEATKTANRRVEYSVKAELPAGNSTLKIIIRPKSSEEGEEGNAWGGYNQGSDNNWNITRNNITRDSFTLTVIESGKPTDLSVIFLNDCIIEYYENGATEPTKVKEISVFE
jgi:hypothetical protein